MGHAHAPVETSVGIRRRLAVAAAIAALATLAGLFALWPPADPLKGVDQLGFSSAVYDATIQRVEEAPCDDSPGGDDLLCRSGTVRLRQGPDKGSVRTVELPAGRGPSFSAGDTVVVSHEPDAPEGFEYGFADRNRKAVLWWLAALFAITVVALGRIRGLAALAGLAASFVVLLKFILPAILAGSDPLLVSVVGASAIAFVALYVAHGFGPMTSVALLGTLASLGVTVLLANLFVDLAQLTGFASEEASYLNVATTRIDLAGLVLGGIVIGALGAIDDMTVTQASVVAELRHANPDIGGVRLFASAMRIGRDHVASTVNTLALAYAGASMPLLVLFVLSEQSLGSVVNGEVVATEVIRTLVGSIGLVTSVPLTTWLAVVVLGERPGRWRAGADAGDAAGGR